MSQRAELKAQVRTLFKADDFSALEKLSASFRDGSARTQSGIWKLTVFYGAFQDAASEVARDDAAGWEKLAGKFMHWQQAHRSSSPAGWPIHH